MKWYFRTCPIYLGSLSLLLFRMADYNYFWGKYLWAEDGKIFLNQSLELGFWAIFEPYAGYLHFYPRLVTEFSRLFDFLYRPTVLFLGWGLAYLVMIHSLESLFRSPNRRLLAFPLIALAVFQPHYGEVFFNITNAHWLLGTALFIYVLNNSLSESITKYLVLFILSLTGPFSIILLLIYLIKLTIEKSWRSQLPTLSIVSIGASIQLITLLKSNRITTGTINNNPWDWIVAFLKLSFFGANSIWTIAAAFAIWLCIYYLLSEHFFRKNLNSNIQTSVLLLLSALLLIAAGLYTCKHDPGAIVFLGGGNRYTWIPYVFIVVAAVLLSEGRKKITVALFILFGFICYANFHRVSSPNLQFESFAKFGKVQSVYIPISPQWPEFPGWHIALKPQDNSMVAPTMEIKLTGENVLLSNLKPTTSNGHLNLSAIGPSPYLVLGEKILCDGNHVGVNIYLTRKNEGWMRLFWSETQEFDESQALRRWYPSGSIKAQFAFPMMKDGLFLRLDPLENTGDVSIEKIDVFCL